MAQPPWRPVSYRARAGIEKLLTTTACSQRDGKRFVPHRRQSLEQRFVKRVRVLHLRACPSPANSTRSHAESTSRPRGRAPVMAELGAHLGRRGILADRAGVLLSDGHAGEILLDDDSHDGEATNCDPCGGPVKLERDGGCGRPRVGSSARQRAASRRQVTIRIRFRPGVRVREEGPLHHRL